MEKKPKISKSESLEIGILLAKKYGVRDIARSLRRSPSSVSEEIKRNKVNGKDDPLKAHHKAYVRRRLSKYQGMKIVGHLKLKEKVDTLLWDDQSPRAIAGRLGTISKASICRYIRSPYGRNIESHRARLKHRRRGRLSRKHGLSDRVFIAQRPVHIGARMRSGHAEGDFIVSGKSGKGVLLVVVDRKTRIVFLERIPKPSCMAVAEAMLKIKGRYPEWRSMTTDNDILFQKHKQLEVNLGIHIYFCEPYHAWEKGSVENVNGYIRRFVPKGSDISRYSKRFFSKLEAKMNRRILEVLKFKTPNEVRTKLQKQKQRREAQVEKC